MTPSGIAGRPSSPSPLLSSGVSTAATSMWSGISKSWSDPTATAPCPFLWSRPTESPTALADSSLYPNVHGTAVDVVRPPSSSHQHVAFPRSIGTTRFVLSGGPTSSTVKQHSKHSFHGCLVLSGYRLELVRREAVLMRFGRVGG